MKDMNRLPEPRKEEQPKKRYPDPSPALFVTAEESLRREKERKSSAKDKTPQA